MVPFNVLEFIRKKMVVMQKIELCTEECIDNNAVATLASFHCHSTLPVQISVHHTNLVLAHICHGFHADLVVKENIFRKILACAGS